MGEGLAVEPNVYFLLLIDFHRLKMSGRDRERILSQSAPDSIKKRALSFPRPIETKMESVPQEKLKELLDLNSSIFSDMKDLGVTLYRVSESAKVRNKYHTYSLRRTTERQS